MSNLRPFLIAGNWKMNCSPAEAEELLKSLREGITENPENVEILVCPPSISLTTAADSLNGTAVKVGAQNVHFEDNGAYTGEISTQMLSEVNCDYVITGHSERRQYFGETDEIVNKKTAKILEAGMKPIICVGESLDERRDEVHKKVVKEQVEAALNGIVINSIKNIVIAYEPIWAIGTGETATPEQAEEMHKLIRETLKTQFGEETSEQVQILYGGSMKPHNAEELLSQRNVDGGLIGGASLKAESFAEIIEISQSIRS